jgi:nicotinamidase/pyrazinamidase
VIEVGPSDVLLVVDVQVDFCPGGALPVHRGDEVIPLVNRLTARAPHVVLTQDWHPLGHVSFASSHPGKRPYEVVTIPSGPQILWPDHCVLGSAGAAFHPDLDTRRAEAVLRKGFRLDLDSYSAFFENDRTTPTGLGGYLRERGLDRVLLAGLATDFCVAWSAADARRLGLEVVVIEDATRGIDQAGSLAAAWADMAAAGVIRATCADLVLP